VAIPGSIGRPGPNNEAKIIDESGNELGPNEVGELLVRGNCLRHGFI
jgi:acyl-CoA synthetase (AMP-forming)/AMP-acid ligase II